MARRSFVHIAVVALLAAAGSSAALAQSTAITYQGQVKNGGSVVNSPSDFRFSLFTAAVGGTQVGSTVTQNAVAVADGLFTTPVDFGFNPYTSGNQNTFLQIEVRNPAGSGAFVPMGARQQLTAAPFSLATRGINVTDISNISSTNDSQVGIGTESPQSLLHVVGTGFFTDIDVPYGIFETAADASSGNRFGPQVRLKHGGPGGQDWVTVSAGSGNGPAGSLMFVRSGSSSVPLTLSPTDNVGIGTVTPANRLSVNGNADISGRLGVGIAAPQAPLHVRAPQVTTAAVMQVDTCGAPCGGQNYTEALRLINIAVAGGLPNGAGQVGIGLATAAAATATSTADAWIGTGFPSDPGNGSNDFIVATKTSPTTLTNRLRINGDNGNVGIGTDAPTARLHNVGTTRLDGSLQFGADLQNGNTLRWNRFDGGPGSTLATLDISPVTVANSSAFAISRNGSQVFLFQLDGVAGKLGGGAWAVLSDERTKNDIQPMTGTLDRLLQLKGHAYTYKPEFVQDGRALPGTQIGLVAQEVEAVFPDWVTTGADGLKQVTERSTTALMVEALRDLRTEKDAEINDLKARLEKLEALLAAQVASQAK
jgi:hypothetical protein